MKVWIFSSIERDSRPIVTKAKNEGALLTVRSSRGNF